MNKKQDLKNIQLLHKDLRQLPDEEIGPFIKEQFLQNCSPPNPDPDKLLLLGEKAKQVNREIINAEIINFLSFKPDVVRLEVIAWFIMGYWTRSDAISDQLIDVILNCFERNIDNPTICEPLLYALCYLNKDNASANAIVKIKALTQKIIQTGNTPPSNSFAEGAILYILNL